MKDSEKDSIVKFVSYDGEYPNLCSGTLMVEINGKKTSFGWTNPRWLNEKKADYPRFWCSGGSTGFSDDYADSYVVKGPWEMLAQEKDYPPEIWKLLPEILDLMNENVREGCCGGCL